MREDCTELFLRYREIARLVWNLGFWPDPELREIECVLAFEYAMARLFEGMVLLRFGYTEQLKRFPDGLGEAVDFRVTGKAAAIKLAVDRYKPNSGTHEWGSPVVNPSVGSYDLRFMSFFDWSQLAIREYRSIVVLIERLDERPDLVGHLAIVDLEKCSIWLAEEPRSEPEPPCAEDAPQ
jgi:hypothetical protein